MAVLFGKKTIYTSINTIFIYLVFLQRLSCTKSSLRYAHFVRDALHQHIHAAHAAVPFKYLLNEYKIRCERVKSFKEETQGQKTQSNRSASDFTRVWSTDRQIHHVHGFHNRR